MTPSGFAALLGAGRGAARPDGRYGPRTDRLEALLGAMTAVLDTPGREPVRTLAHLRRSPAGETLAAALAHPEAALFDEPLRALAADIAARAQAREDQPNCPQDTPAVQVITESAGAAVLLSELLDEDAYERLVADARALYSPALLDR